MRRNVRSRVGNCFEASAWAAMIVSMVLASFGRRATAWFGVSTSGPASGFATHWSRCFSDVLASRRACEGNKSNSLAKSQAETRSELAPSACLVLRCALRVSGGPD
jgi:hypothetical protein